MKPEYLVYALLLGFFLRAIAEQTVDSDGEEKGGKGKNGTKVQLHLMGFASIDIGANGWSSAGVIPSIDMAVEDINARDDLLEEYDIVVHMKDTECDPGKSVHIFYNHISKPPTKLMILGGGCSVSTAPIARTAKHFGLVQMGYSAASPELSVREFYPQFFRTCMSDYAMNRPIISLCLHHGWNHVATLMEQDPLFSTTINQLHQYIHEANITLLTAESFKYDPTEPIKNIKRKKVKIIVLDAYEGPGRTVFCQVYREQLYGAKFQWIIPGWWGENWMDVNDTDCTVEQVKEAAELALTVTDLKIDLSGEESISGQTYTDYEARYRQQPALAQYGYNAYHPFGYDAVWAVALALNASIPVIAEQTLTVRHANGTESRRPKRLEDFQYSTEQDMTKVFFDSLGATRFQGVSGPVAFELGERSAVSDVGQIQHSKWVRVGVHFEESNKMFYEEDAEILWHGNGPPRSMIYPVLEVQYNEVGLVISACVLAALGVALALGFLGFNVANLDHMHIKMSSPRLNNLIVLGCLLAYFAVVLFGLDTQFIAEDAMAIVCLVQAYVTSSAFTLAFGAMFAKTWRVHQIFTRPTVSSKAVKDVHLFAFVAFLWLLDMGVLTTWAVMDPYEHKLRNDTETEDAEGQITIYQLEYCDSEFKWHWMMSIYAVKGLLLIFGCFLAYETRSVHIPGLNDSKYIGMCVYNVVVMCVVGVTVSLVLNGKANVSYCFQAICLVFCATTTLCLLFIPKVKYVRKHPEESSDPKKRGTSVNTGSNTFKYSMAQAKKKTASIYNSAPDPSMATITETDSPESAELAQKNKEIADLKKRFTHMENLVKKLGTKPETADKSTQTPENWDVENPANPVKNAAVSSSGAQLQKGINGSAGGAPGSLAVPSVDESRVVLSSRSEQENNESSTEPAAPGSPKSGSKKANPGEVVLVVGNDGYDNPAFAAGFC